MIKSIFKIKKSFHLTYNKLTFLGCLLGSVNTPDSYILEEDQFCICFIGFIIFPIIIVSAALYPVTLIYTGTFYCSG